MWHTASAVDSDGNNLSPLRGCSYLLLRFPGLAPRAMCLSPLRGFSQIPSKQPYLSSFRMNQTF